MFKNICLIGLPYSGKSILGNRLALTKNIGFIEIDRMIELAYKNSLKDIINTKGIKNFLHIEEEIAKKIYCKNTIISTGGSIVYSPDAIYYFKKNLNCKIINLHLTFDEFNSRIDNLDKRGVINPYNLSIKEFYKQRTDLCELYSDVTILADSKKIALRKLLKNDF
tara:strand:+ start:411 stop:908 length:498 start_codon:yes stop_codon:yes gene_type:complete